MKKRKMGKNKMDLYSIIIGVVVSGLLLYSLAGNIRTVFPNSLLVSKTKQLAPELVCMVNNVYVGKLQIEIIVNKKAYYVGCGMCKDKLNNDSTTRYSKDPLTGEVVDKADAFIVLRSKKNDLVHYFKSKENFQKNLENKKLNKISHESDSHTNPDVDLQ